MTIPSTMYKTDFASGCHPLATCHHPPKTLISFQFLNNFFFFSNEFPFKTLDIRRILLLKRKQTYMLGETKQNSNVLLVDYKLNQYLILGFRSTFSQQH